MVSFEKTSMQVEKTSPEISDSMVAPEASLLTGPVEPKKTLTEVQQRAIERSKWVEEKMAETRQAIEAIKAEESGSQVRVTGMVGPDYEGISRTNELFRKLSEELNQSQRSILKDNEVYAQILPAGEGIYVRKVQDVGKPGIFGGQKMRTALDVIRADSIDTLKAGDKESVLKKGTLEPAPKGESTVSLWEFLKLQHKIGHELKEGYEGPSKLTIMLRCIGHSAANTVVEIEDEVELPPVNPWKLTKAVGRSVISREERRAMFERIKEDSGLPGSLMLLVIPGAFMRGDLLGYLAMPELYKMAKEEGLSDKDAASDVIVRLASAHLPKDSPGERTAA